MPIDTQVLQKDHWPSLDCSCICDSPEVVLLHQLQPTVQAATAATASHLLQTLLHLLHFAPNSGKAQH